MSAISFKTQYKISHTVQNKPFQRMLAIVQHIILTDITRVHTCFKGQNSIAFSGPKINFKGYQPKL